MCGGLKNISAVNLHTVCHAKQNVGMGQKLIIQTNFVRLNFGSSENLAYFGSLALNFG